MKLPAGMILGLAGMTAHSEESDNRISVHISHRMH